MEKCQPFSWTSGSLPLAEKIFQLIEFFLAGTGKLCLFNKNPKLGLALLLMSWEFEEQRSSYPSWFSIGFKKVIIFFFMTANFSNRKC